MSSTTKDKQVARARRHYRVRKKVSGTTIRPRLAVFRSNKHISAQVIDDSTGRTVAAASSTEKAIRSKVGQTGNTEAATAVGKLVAERALGKGITDVIFDRGGYRYHGRVKALAEAAREGGLKF